MPIKVSNFSSFYEAMEKHQYESVQALVRQLHAPNKNVSRPHSDEETSNDEAKDRNRNVHSLPILAVEKPQRKRSIFDTTFKIPILTITGPHSPETPESIAHRRFSFGNFRRHSHSSVSYKNNYYALRELFELILIIIRELFTNDIKSRACICST